MLLPQRYIFSSKSQLYKQNIFLFFCCCCYHKGTYFQANHNLMFNKEFLVVLLLLPQRYIFSSKSQLTFYNLLFKKCCCCYHKGTYFQANHNNDDGTLNAGQVVVATTKVHIFKQITTTSRTSRYVLRLLLLPQRYIFSSKSQPRAFIMDTDVCCCCYHKGTYFQANHNGVTSA